MSPEPENRVWVAWNEEGFLSLSFVTFAEGKATTYEMLLPPHRAWELHDTLQVILMRGPT